MGTKIRVDQVPMDDIEDWDEEFDEKDGGNRVKKVSYNSKKRRQIEERMEERLLARQISSGYDENYFD
ncbi:PA3496 family putative envelope integrity protein [Marinobacterium aestuariivivens]|uniref:PA3496 family putative envelope integrity protein n=1 Tax=Marinobacterium aestuariivivens TaxID=1698799 RepID=A0ABW2A4D1_9GAMM